MARVEAGEEIIIAVLWRIRKETSIETAIAEIRAMRALAKPVTQDETRAWRDQAGPDDGVRPRRLDCCQLVPGRQAK
ncbi:hypothetical protein [Sinorhizobium mexicanum]|uniref:hypothetical protein n=1 Tax=Sinorhizobium mexicanum TaxID=375549 RepID=UPI001DC94032|nr:hypothetical protein [Sinorhizobium mexicanum]MBP1888106.1 hypothetical protein [Sinorhizobium mexicanum]